MNVRRKKEDSKTTIDEVTLSLRDWATGLVVVGGIIVTLFVGWHNISSEIGKLQTKSEHQDEQSQRIETDVKALDNKIDKYIESKR